MIAFLIVFTGLAVVSAAINQVGVGMCLSPRLSTGT